MENEVLVLPVTISERLNRDAACLEAVPEYENRLRKNEKARKNNKRLSRGLFALNTLTIPFVYFLVRLLLAPAGLLFANNNYITGVFIWCALAQLSMMLAMVKHKTRTNYLSGAFRGLEDELKIEDIELFKASNAAKYTGSLCRLIEKYNRVAEQINTNMGFWCKYISPVEARNLISDLNEIQQELQIAQVKYLAEQDEKSVLILPENLAGSKVEALASTQVKLHLGDLDRTSEKLNGIIEQIG